MSDSASTLCSSQQQVAEPRTTNYPSNLNSQHFDVAAELTAANASIHDGRSAQLTPSILKSRDSAFSYPFLRGSTALYEQPFDFSPAPSVDVLPIQPFFSIAEQALPVQSKLEGLALRPEVSVPAIAYSNMVPRLRNVFSIVPSTYGSHVAAFQVRGLSALTPNLKERLGDIVGSAHDACQDLLVEMTKEFRDVLDQIRDLAKHEEDRGIDSLLREFTDDRGLPPSSGSSPSQTTNQRPRDQDLNWQASTLKFIHRRRDVMVQHLNLLSKSRMVGVPEPGSYRLRKLNYGPQASFLHCLQIEKGEWVRLWEILHVESERVSLTKERMSTLVKLWGVHFNTLEGTSDLIVG
ncbi:hypothetical protein MMC18_003408 [Xylographa bjoerkii]|nr:hypothetical protein [Xylographa bjoerkii]